PMNTEFRVETGLTNRNITALEIAKNVVFAGTAGSGVFRSHIQSSDNQQQLGDRWEQVINGLSDLEIRCLALEYKSLDPENTTPDDTALIVWAGTARGGVFRSEDYGDHWQPINTNLTNTDIRSILASQSTKQTSATIVLGGVGFLVSDDGFQVKPVQKHDEVEVRHPPGGITQVVGTHHYQWSLKDKDGFSGTLDITHPTDITLLPANPDSELMSEVVEIQRPPTNQQLPLLTLQQAIHHSYDPTTVSVLANIVAATHGEMVSEVLGSGDGHATHQSFILKEPPLTFIPAANAAGADSSLNVRVNGVLWQPTDSLYKLNSHDESYTVRLEDDGTTFVLFGDGIRGSRLPTGEENITATYRSGMGLVGNVGADSLSILKTRPQGISDVINPLAATGAANPERLADARTKAPSTVRTLARIVSLYDFEDFALGFAGIGKAQAVPLWNGETQLVHITIAGINGAAVTPDTNLYTQLETAMNQARDPVQQMEISSFTLLRFNLEARVLIDDRYLVDDVQKNVEAALHETFAFDHRDFGQAVTTAEIIGVIQAVEGVVAVNIEALYQRDRSRALEASLEASLAQFNPQTGQITPAQLLLPNPAGLKLTLGGTL
ncbi:MAG: putative baseplate assembly protein, partial [Cyanobacteria bacterium P01_H01_bin.105]